MSTQPPDRHPEASEQNTAPQHPDSESGAGFSAPSRTLRILHILMAVLFVIILAITAYSSRLEREALRTVRFCSSGMKDQIVSIPYGEKVSLPDGPSIEHLHFLNWVDEDGHPEERAEFPVYRDMVLTAQYSPAFPEEKHIPYLHATDDGILNIGATVLVRDFVQILYTLLDTNEVGIGRFTDVSADDPCFDAAALLKDLGVFTGTRLHPDEPLTRYDLLHVLLTLAPPPEAEEDVPASERETESEEEAAAEEENETTSADEADDVSSTESTGKIEAAEADSEEENDSVEGNEAEAEKNDDLEAAAEDESESEKEDESEAAAEDESDAKPDVEADDAAEDATDDSLEDEADVAVEDEADVAVEDEADVAVEDEADDESDEKDESSGGGMPEDAVVAVPSFSDLSPDDTRFSVFSRAASVGWIPCGDHVPSDVDKSLCFGDLALIINHALHRDCPRLALPVRIGTILDVPATSVYYDAAVEAAIPHEYRLMKGHEVWLSSKPLPMREPGFFFSGVRLHYIDEEGNPVADADLGGLHFNRNGEITTGVPELDEKLWNILEELIDPSEMTREEMLRIVYDYVVDNFHYRTWTVYERGAEGWAEKEALRMLREKRGNCYCFAALFYELARFVGFDAKIYSGIVYGDQRVYRTEEGTPVYSPQAYTPHGWVEIAFDGVDYIFDTEYEYKNDGNLDMFMAGEGLRGQYGYKKGPAP